MVTSPSSWYSLYSLMVINSSYEVLQQVAQHVGLSTFQFIVVLGMLLAGGIVKWTFNHDHRDHHHDE